MFDVIRFWLDRGVDGFRVDAPETLLEDPEFRDNPVNPDYKPAQPSYDRFLPIYTRDVEDTHVIMAMMRRVFDAYPGAYS